MDISAAVLSADVRGLGGRRERRLLPAWPTSGHERARGARRDPGRHARPADRAEVRDADADPAGHAEGRHDHDAGRQTGRLLRDLDEAVRAADPAGRLPATTVWGYGAVKSASKKGAADPQRAVAHDRGAVEPARARQVDQRSRGRERQLPAAPASRRPDAALGQPARRRRRPRHAADLRRDTRSVHGSRAHRDARPRRGGGRRRERRLRRGLVPAGGGQHPGGIRDRRHLVRLLQGQGRGELRRRLGARVRHLPVPEQQPRVDALVPRPHARHDPPQRLRRAGRLLPRPRRTGRREGRARQPLRHDCRAARPGAHGRRQVPAQQDLLRDPDRDPGPRVQRRRLALLPGQPRVLRRRHGRRSGLHPGHRPLADLEPRVLRQHDHGQRQHLAVPDRRAAPLPASASSTAASRAS